jgi:adenylylsulfate kinase-like enzyme
LEKILILWITGLSAAGKTTLAKEISVRLRMHGSSVVMLDGDELREVFGTGADNLSGHNREGRLALSMRYALLCRLIADQGHIVIISTISLFHEVHAWNRAELPGYFEVYLKVPVEELRRRDPKGIYRRYDSGEIANVAGLDLVVDEPKAPDWVAEYSPDIDVHQLADNLIQQLMEKKML